jgi:hypothetical protein
MTMKLLATKTNRAHRAAINVTTTNSVRIENCGQRLLGVGVISMLLFGSVAGTAIAVDASKPISTAAQAALPQVKLGQAASGYRLDLRSG